MAGIRLATRSPPKDYLRAGVDSAGYRSASQLFSVLPTQDEPTDIPPGQRWGPAPNTFVDQLIGRNWLEPVGPAPNDQLIGRSWLKPVGPAPNTLSTS